MSQSKSLIFADWPNGNHCYFPYYEYQGEPTDLAGRVEMVSAYMDGFTPVAWAPDGTACSERARAKSIAAGRVIKLIDGKYVPFENGAPVVPIEEKPAPVVITRVELVEGPFFYAGPWVPAQRIVWSNTSSPSEVAFDWAEDADPNAGMIARDGPAKPKSYAPFTPFGPFAEEALKSTAKPALPSLTSSPDLAGEWKPFEFGSAHLKG